MEKLLLKIEPSEITPFFYNNVFRFRGDFPPSPLATPLGCTNIEGHELSIKFYQSSFLDWECYVTALAPSYAAIEWECAVEEVALERRVFDAVVRGGGPESDPKKIRAHLTRRTGER